MWKLLLIITRIGKRKKNRHKEKDNLEKQMSDLKTQYLHLETKLHRKQNKDTQLTKQQAIRRKPTDRTDHERGRKKIFKKNWKKKKQTKNYAIHVNQGIMK